jgi:DNA polymerase III epsilon subunit-like protein
VPTDTTSTTADDAAPADATTDVDAGARTADAAPQGTRFVFVDTEATGLDHARHELTEVAWIVRFEDGREEERRYFPQHTIDGADDDALELTHYEERIAPQDKTPAKVWLTEFLDHADGAVLVGAVPDFDARHLDLACRKLGVAPTWDHHLLDVETLALPFIAPGPEMPRSLAKTCAALDLPHDKDQAHGALYDAQQAKAVFDRVWDLVAQLRASGDPLPPPVPRERRNGDADVATDDPTAEAVEASGATDTGQPDHAPS